MIRKKRAKKEGLDAAILIRRLLQGDVIEFWGITWSFVRTMITSISRILSTVSVYPRGVIRKGTLKSGDSCTCLLRTALQ